MRKHATITIAVLAALGAGPVAAQSYPAKPIRFIIPFPPAGNTDLLGRAIAQKLAEAWGQQVLVDNRAGAGGTVGVELGAKAAPDGYTIVMGTFGSVLVANSLYKNLAYDPQRDLAPVVLVSTPPGLMVVHPSLPAKNVREFIALARANRGRLNYVSSGPGTWNHLFGELFKAQAKIDMVHVPYKGAVPAATDLVGGHVEMMFAPFPAVLSHWRANRLRALAVTGAKRSGLLPEVPTVSESGLPAYEAEGWFAVLAPAKTPQPLIARLNQEINRILQLPEVKSTLAADGAEPVGGTPEALAESIRKGSVKWAKVVEALAIRQ